MGRKKDSNLLLLGAYFVNFFIMAARLKADVVNVVVVVVVELVNDR